MGRKTQTILLLILFMSPLLALFAFIEWQLRVLPDDFREVKNEFEQRTDARVLLLGTSHMQSLRSNQFEYATVNGALPAQSLLISSQLAEMYIRQLSKLQMVVINLSLFSRDHIEYGTRAIRMLYKYSSMFGIFGSAPLNERLDLRFYSRYFAIGWDEALGLLEHDATVSESGDRQPDLDQEATEKELRFHLDVTKAGIEVGGKQFNLSAIQKLAKKLRDRKVALAFVRVPVPKRYADSLEATFYEKVVEDVISSTCSTETRYHDYLRDERFVDADFNNPSHLGREGGEKMARILEEEVIKPVLFTSQIALSLH